jgi:signal transduction histidine kinase
VADREVQVTRPVPARVRMRTVLLALGLVAFALPFAGFAWLRIYDTQLVRQTEIELLAQAAFVVATVDDALDERGAMPLVKDQGVLTFHPHSAKLDIAKEVVRPPADEPVPSEQPADPQMAMASVRLASVLRMVKSTTLAGIRVVDAHGVVVASSNGQVGGSLAHQDEIVRALAGDTVSTLRHRESTGQAPPLSSISRSTGVRVFVATPIEHAGRIVGAVLLSRTPMTLGKAIYEDAVQLGGTAALLLLAVVLVALGAAYTLARPMRALVHQARRVADGAQDDLQELRSPVTEEVAEVSRAFTQLASTLSERSRYIRDFAAHVSHEFKTPLTAIRGAVELVQEHDATMTSAERARFLNNARLDTLRLERLVQRLLELARADMLRPPSGSSAGDVRRVLRSLESRAQTEGLALEISFPDESLLVQMDEETLGSVLWSLIDNSRTHAPGASIRLDVVASDKATLHLRLSDNGPGISLANRARIFTPFFTTTRQRGSTGLGLTIARSILLAHRGTIELLADQPGAHFLIRLPR